MENSVCAGPLAATVDAPIRADGAVPVRAAEPGIDGYPVDAAAEGPFQFLGKGVVAFARHIKPLSYRDEGDKRDNILESKKT